LKAITNQNNESLETVLKAKLATSQEVIFCVSFIRDSGVKLLYDYLKFALNKNAKVTILTSTYMNVTEPIALYRLKSLKSENFKLAIFDSEKVKTSFHIKGYYFKFIDEKEQMIIGSSNISKSALSDGIEWNILFDNTEIISDFLHHYNDLVKNYSFDLTDEWLQNYFNTYIPLKIQFDPESKADANSGGEVSLPELNYENAISLDYQPIKCQIPALYELARTREEGFDKALIVMATGLGKTFLSAFDSKNFKRVLFVAHREEILNQAKDTFKKIRPNANYGFFNADTKDIDKDIIFGSIGTLGKSGYLKEKFFEPDYFDYIIVDEFHHSAASGYLKFLNYFQPKFLLGLTATPDRLDNKDIYQHCDYNIPFECNFKTGINNGWLVPFEYYAIYDDIDYDTIPWRSGKYDLTALENAFTAEKRTENIIQNYRAKGGRHTIAFCCSIRHADFTTMQFNNQGIKSLALHSNTKQRKETIAKFISGEIRVLCVVDIFNEGVDIPHIDTVMFLRPTESFAIFIQQLGRGLRTNANKQKLTVIDFVGNYKNSHLKYSFLTGLTPKDLETEPIVSLEEATALLPLGCSLNFDLQLMDLFKQMRNEKLNRKERLIQHYLDRKDELENPYSLAEFNAASDIPARMYIRTFDSWLDFLVEMFPEDKFLQIINDSKLAQLLSEIEKTSMSKLYKMPTIKALISDGKLQPETSLNKIIKSFKAFYSSSVNAKDFTDESNLDYKEWNEKKWQNLAETNPIKFLSQNPKSIFTYNIETKIFSLILEKKDLSLLNKYATELAYLVEDRINFRREDYVVKKKYK